MCPKLYSIAYGEALLSDPYCLSMSYLYLNPCSSSESFASFYSFKHNSRGMMVVNYKVPCASLPLSGYKAFYGGVPKEMTLRQHLRIVKNLPHFCHNQCVEV